MSMKACEQLIIPFTEYSATKNLKNLAKEPINLTKDKDLNIQRLTKFSAQACNYQLLYGTECINEEILDNLFELADEAQVLKKMKKMQEGEITNYIQGYSSDNRPVLHTATRDFFAQRTLSPIANQASLKALKEISKLKNFIQKNNHDYHFTDLVVIAIGGSNLGPHSHYLALKYLSLPHRHVHFVTNLDPDSITSLIHGLDLKKTLVLVMSKSGTTLETATNESFIRQYFHNQALDSSKHFISVSTEGSPLDDQTKYLECFYIWNWVGGRFSTSSMMGGVLLAFAFGFEVFWEFLQGAHAMDQVALSSDTNKNLPLLGALLGIWNRNFLNYGALAIVPYSHALKHYPAHIQQVDMESNGKCVDQQGNNLDFETGPLIFGEAGTSAQHSFFQLLHQGTTIIPVEFIGFKECQRGQDHLLNSTTSQQKLLANLFAQSIALAQGKSDQNPNKLFPGNRPSHMLLGEKLTPYALGSLLAYYEHKVAFQGFIWGINSFDQEGVQLGKELATKFIYNFAIQNGSKDKRELTHPLGDTFLNFLKKL